MSSESSRKCNGRLESPQFEIGVGRELRACTSDDGNGLQEALLAGPATIAVVERQVKVRESSRRVVATHDEAAERVGVDAAVEPGGAVGGRREDPLDDAERAGSLRPGATAPLTVDLTAAERGRVRRGDGKDSLQGRSVAGHRRWFRGSKHAPLLRVGATRSPQAEACHRLRCI